MTTPPAADQHDTVPDSYQYTQEIVDLLLHDRGTLVDAAQRIVADVQARAQSQGLTNTVRTTPSLSGTSPDKGVDGRRADVPLARSGRVPDASPPLTGRPADPFELRGAVPPAVVVEHLHSAGRVERPPAGA